MAQRRGWLISCSQGLEEGNQGEFPPEGMVELVRDGEKSVLGMKWKCPRDWSVLQVPGGG